MSKPIQFRALQGSLVGTFAFLITFLQAIVLVPVMLRFWGVEKYGLWISVSAIASLAQTINTGHQNYIGNEFCRTYDLDLFKLRKILASALWTDLGISVVCFLGLLFVVGLGSTPALLSLEQPIVRQYQLDISILILVGVWLCCSSITGVIGRLYAPAGELPRALWIGVIMRLSQTFAVIFTAVLGGNILLACIASSIATVFATAFMILDVKHRFRELYPFWIGASWGTGWSNLRKSLLLTVSNGLFQIQTSVLILLISNSLGVLYVTQLSTMRTVSNIFLQATTIIAQPLAPEIARYQAKAEREKLTDTLSVFCLIGGFTINTVVLITLPVVETVYFHWTGNKISFDWSLYLLLVLAVVLKNLGTPFITYLQGINHLRAQSIIAICQSALILGISKLLVHQLGLISVGLAILISEIVGSVIFPLWFSSQEIKSLKGKFPGTQFLLSAASVVWMGLIFVLVNQTTIGLWIVSILGLIGLAIIHFFQWMLLPKHVRERISQLIFRIVSRDI